MLAIELLCACQALEFADITKVSPAARAVYDLIRSAVPPLVQDRLLAPEIGLVKEMIASGRIVEAAEGKVGRLN